MLATQINFAQTAPDHRGTGRCNILHASADPALNLATLRAQAMTDDQRYQAGFDHAFNNQGARGSLSGYEAYWFGRAAGRAARF
ncbi:hypothetical protein [Stenomitos frigidus]|uniref:Uncharacterized protein n=1 Tax=Stenomitos frigidus ULC18 TaxID=2107698 RepID=A0A2T1EAZ0_9CYAN|nr:hypothetical protein [Stenomitos frigidus]PSB29922.1 hypothetical protein C7B82_10235 [Stenomitos frigidus ULC18]